MLSESLLAILRCPEDRSELTPAAPALVARINARVAAGRAVSRAGRPLQQPIDGGLVRARGDVLYPIVNGIPRLLVEEGISLAEFELVTPGQ